MKRSLLIYSSFLVLTTVSARANFVLSFTGLKSNEPVLNFYNGGFGGMGSGPGPNLGITFTSNFLAIPGQGGPGGPPAPDGRVALLAGSSATMNVPTGFTNFFSFYYTASDNAGLVTIWSGLDGSGTRLNSIALPAATVFTPTGTPLGAIARSVLFTGTPNALQFDNLTDTGQVLPEPSSLWLVGTALAFAAAIRARRGAYRD